MLKQKFKKELLTSNSIVFKTEKGSLFKVYITNDSFSITQNVGNQWRFYTERRDLEGRKLKDALIFKVFDIIDNL